MPNSTLTIELPEKLKVEFIETVGTSDMTPDQLIQDFIGQYLGHDTEQGYWEGLARDVAQSNAQIERGEGVDGEAVEAYFAKKCRAASAEARRVA